MPLQPIPLAAESYQLLSTPAAQHRLVNLYAEALPDGARSKYYLKSTPGLALETTCGTGPVTASASSGDTFFCISGSNAYRFTVTGSGIFSTPVDLGYLAYAGASFDDNSHHSIAIGLPGPVFCVPPYAFTGSFTASSINMITPGAGNFPTEGVSSVCYLDGYYIFTVFGGEYFFTSDLLSPSVFSGVSYTKISSEVDFVEHCTPHNGELWLFGRRTISAWYNSGDPTTPFAPRTGAVIRGGCGAYKTVRRIDGSLWWVSVDGVVYRTAGGYQAKRVSTHAIEEVLATFYAGVGSLKSLWACTFTHEGHSFYALTLPLFNRTWVYDCTTDMWHERSSNAGGTTRWTINTASETPMGWVLGDSADGRMWSMDRATATEKGVSMPRLAQLPAIVTHGPRAFMSRLELEMQVGIGGVSSPVQVSWSDDGGTNYTTPRSLATGSSGQLRTRVATTRLGSFRQRVLRLTGTGSMTVYGCDADMGVGES
jgi:hypothetical protein